MKKIIQICGQARTHEPVPISLWLQRADFEDFNGSGHFDFTVEKEMAQRFNTFQEAVEFCHTIPKNRPRKLDGSPNRPLMLYKVYIMDEDLDPI